MKLSIPKQTIVSALATVNRAVSTRTTLPALSHVLIRTFEKSVEFVATDLELFIRVRVDAEVKEKGSLTVSAKLFQQIVSALPAKGDDLVKLEVIKGALRITNREAKYNLAILDADQFPDVPRLKSSAKFKLFQQTLRSLFQLASYPSVTTDEGRHTLTGTLLTTGKKGITAVATDGRRLAELTIEMEEDLELSETIIPRNTVRQLMSLLGDDEATVSVAAGENMIDFNFNVGDAQVTLVSKIIEGSFPNYKQVVPDVKNVSGVVIARVDLLDTVRRVSLLGGNVKFDFAQQLLTVSAKSELKEVPGDASESLLIPRCRAGVVHCNARYVIEALDAATEDQVLFYHTGASSPIVIKPVIPKDKDKKDDKDAEPCVTHPWQAVIMPMKADEPTVEPEKDAKAPAAEKVEDEDKSEGDTEAAEEPETADAKA